MVENICCNVTNTKIKASHEMKTLLSRSTLIPQQLFTCRWDNSRWSMCFKISALSNLLLLLPVYTLLRYCAPCVWFILQLVSMDSLYLLWLLLTLHSFSFPTSIILDVLQHSLFFFSFFFFIRFLNSLLWEWKSFCNKVPEEVLWFINITLLDCMELCFYLQRTEPFALTLSPQPLNYCLLLRL